MAAYILYFDLYLYSAYVAHYAYLNKRRVLLVILLILRKATVQRHVWARTWIQRRQEFGFSRRVFTEIRINTDKLGFFHFAP